MVSAKYFSSSPQLVIEIRSLSQLLSSACDFIPSSQFVVSAILQPNKLIQHRLHQSPLLVTSDCHLVASLPTQFITQRSIIPQIGSTRHICSSSKPVTTSAGHLSSAQPESRLFSPCRLCSSSHSSARHLTWFSPLVIEASHIVISES